MRKVKILIWRSAPFLRAFPGLWAFVEKYISQFNSGFHVPFSRKDLREADRICSYQPG
jgi:hypothetical protein